MVPFCTHIFTFILSLFFNDLYVLACRLQYFQYWGWMFLLIKLLMFTLVIDLELVFKSMCVIVLTSSEIYKNSANQPTSFVYPV